MSILIIGGTGTLGQELTRQLYGKDQITIFSRDEHKQAAMKRKYPECKYILGDIRDKDSFDVLGLYDEIYIVAALKHVDILEENPWEAIKTNVLGIKNVFDQIGTLPFVEMKFCTTDKAVNPINTYGATKMLGEKIAKENNASIYRWGNVIGSQGSAIPHFVECLKNDQPIPLTHPDMTRFWIRIEDAAKFMIENEGNVKSGILIPPMKAAYVTAICLTLGELLNKPVEFKPIGLRPGEKIHEELDDGRTSETSEKYTRDELKELLKEFV